MRLVEYLDKGASLGPDAPVPVAGRALSYGEVQGLSHGWPGRWPGPGSRPATRWPSCRPTTRSRSPAFRHRPRRRGVVPVNPRNEAAENRELLALFDCSR